MTSQNNAQSNRELQESSLDRRYGKIGIPAVAAALRYQGPIKNPVPTPSATRGGQGAPR